MSIHRDGFYIPDGKYTLRTFQQAIIDKQSSLFKKGEKRKWVKVHCIRTKEEVWRDTLRKYLKRDMGDIWHIALPMHNQAVDFYVGCYTPKLLLFYTVTRSEEYESAISKLINTTSGFGRMWIGPRKFESLILNFVEMFQISIKRFYASSYSKDSLQAQRRPNIPRNIYWNAIDSLDTLFELRELYGVRPTRVMMHFKAGNIQIANEGLFVLTRLKQEMFDAMEEALNFIRADEEHMTTVSQSMHLEVVPLRLEKGELMIPEITSGKIVLSNATLNKLVVKNFMDKSKSFEFIDEFDEEGSFSWVATAIDKEKRSAFEINSNDKEITLVPRYGTTFEGLLEFYREILERVDDSATLVPFGGSVGT